MAVIPRLTFYSLMVESALTHFRHSRSVTIFSAAMYGCSVIYSDRSFPQPPSKGEPDGNADEVNEDILSPPLDCESAAMPNSSLLLDHCRGGRRHDFRWLQSNEDFVPAQ